VEIFIILIIISVKNNCVDQEDMLISLYRVSIKTKIMICKSFFYIALHCKSESMASISSSLWTTWGAKKISTEFAEKSVNKKKRQQLVGRSMRSLSLQIDSLLYLQYIGSVRRGFIEVFVCLFRWNLH